MNRRRLVILLLAGFVPTAIFAVWLPLRTSAQQQRPRTQSMRVETLSPELEKVFKDWELASDNFKKLRGDFHRIVYDSVFQVEKRAVGTFYFDAPDKGRLDIKPDKSVKPGTVSRKKRGKKDGKPFSVVPDQEAHWICNGKEVSYIDVVQKVVKVSQIPEENRGDNIIDGPLPFLFGMKAEEAKRRYQQLALNPRKPYEVPVAGRLVKVFHIHARPRWKKDAAYWSKAEVLLDAKNFYPVAIKLIDPAGNSETVYAFSNVHEPSWWDDRKKPFVVKIPRGFKRVVNHSGPTMPLLLGKHWKTTIQPLREELMKAGFQISLPRGKPAPKQELVYRVYEQDPPPSTPLKKGQTIMLTMYDKMATTSRVRQPKKRTVRKQSRARKR